jgi:hypothetical protein
VATGSNTASIARTIRLRILVFNLFFKHPPYVQPDSEA